MTSRCRCPEDAEYFQEPCFIKMALYLGKNSQLNLKIKVHICALCVLKSVRLQITVWTVGVCLVLVNYTDKQFFLLHLALLFS